jgi:P2 family phage contractile tail tube protein
MFATGEFPAGMDKLEAKIKWASIYQEVEIALTPFITHSFQVRGNIETYTSQGRSSETPGIWLMTGIYKNVGELVFKQHENVEVTSEIALYHFEEYIGGVQMMLVDIMANMFIVNGVDQLANYRANIGG